MDTTQYHDEDLQQLFRQLPVEKPSAGFTVRVMKQVAFEIQQAAKRKRIRLIAWIVSIPCSVALLLLVGFFTRNYWEAYLWKYFEPLLTSLSHTISSITELFSGNEPEFFIPGLLFLTLLLADLFFRRYAERKKLSIY